MNIDLVEIPIRDIVEGYTNSDDEGVFGFGGRLDIRPKYQRNFIYNENDSREVINTINKGFPLNVMYWVIYEGDYQIIEHEDHTKEFIPSEDAKFQVLDGQQRTISFCEYVKKLVSFGFVDENNNPIYFRNKSDDEKNKFLDYKLTIYICKGTDKEKLDWFKVINIAGKVLSDQELRNAVYAGTWLTDAKRYFSRVGGPAASTADGYFNKEVNRQELLELALKWIADRDKRASNTSSEISDYMARHQNDPNANDLWLYFEAVMVWVKATFQSYISEMKNVDWGILYNKYGSNTPIDANGKYLELLKYQDEIGNMKGAFEAVLTGDIKYINPRTFPKPDTRRKYNEQGGVCPYCKNEFAIEDMHGDHIKPWSKGGKTEYTNLQMLCTICNLKKSAHDVAYTPWDASIYEAFDLKKWDEENPE